MELYVSYTRGFHPYYYHEEYGYSCPSDEVYTEDYVKNVLIPEKRPMIFNCSKSEFFSPKMWYTPYTPLIELTPGIKPGGYVQLAEIECYIKNDKANNNECDNNDNDDYDNDIDDYDVDDHICLQYRKCQGRTVRKKSRFFGRKLYRIKYRKATTINTQ